MKKIISLVLVIASLLALSSCGVIKALIENIDLPFVYVDKNGPGVYNHHDFTDEEKALFDHYIGARIPFIKNDDYYIEGYYGTDDYEHGINFCAIGNTDEEFYLYLDMFSDYTLAKTYKDELDCTWNRYVKDDVVVEISYYKLMGTPYVDLYIYSSLSTDVEGGSHIASEDTVITNKDKGLPEGQDGIYEVDLTKAEYVKNVTEQGYYAGGCPTVGSPAVLVIPVEFIDSTAKSKGYSIENIKNAFLKGGKNDYFSVYDYYFTSSYGKLALDITVLDTWFRPERRSSYYYNAMGENDGVATEIGDQLVLNEALDYLDDKMDLSKFDSDKNGMIDAVVLINTLDIGDDDFHWAFRYWNFYEDGDGELYEYDGVVANDYLWASYQFLFEKIDGDGYASYDKPGMSTYTFIHEFGHVLGADDYYDVEYVEDPLGGFDVMDTSAGDHNPYTKFNFGWITSSRLVVTDSEVTVSLKDFQKTGDTVILANDWDEALGAYQEYYVLVYYKNTGVNTRGGGYFSESGVLVYHVNSSLYRDVEDGEIFYDVYNNNTSQGSRTGTVNNLIELVTVKDGDYVFNTGDTLPSVITDEGDELAFTFTVDSVRSDYVTLTVNAK